MQAIKATQDTIDQYWESHAYPVYGDYNDQLTTEQAQALLDNDLDKFYDLTMDHEINVSDHMYQYAIDQMLEDLELDRDAIEGLDVSPSFDFTDLWKTAIRNTKCHVALYPVLDGHRIMGDGSISIPPQIDLEKAEQMYPECEELAVCGRFDLAYHYKELINGKKPTSFILTSEHDDNLIMHDSWNGAGNMGTIHIKENIVITKWDLALDGYSTNRRYGIQDVYGLTGKFWDRCEIVFNYS